VGISTSVIPAEAGIQVTFYHIAAVETKAGLVAGNIIAARSGLDFRDYPQSKFVSPVFSRVTHLL
jgi:hypothetical protein